ncbi:pyrroline-5-carboxylate reductase [Rhizobium sp. KAs_5_22]|uniref:pyrroline-5-carboxylate reductase n=1 Tax=Ciceribacter selenitireducens TaxID=448181 RepID=UPI00048C3FAA|nr:pyrroline-5-carboxylate reductase [Ciceribacter selenitireducens]PPJ49258.1 pyrroline-5-carboxylate reductase [Rhizobium sp. KAs_5_22]
MAVPKFRLGFIGTGTITEAIVTGLVSREMPVPEIVVSPRSAKTAERLALLSEQVTVAVDNQHVVDAADMLFLAVRPNVAEEVVRALQFRPGQKVVSLIATVDHAILRSMIGAPVNLVRAVPLPFVATLTGVTTVFPPDVAVEALFSTLGTAVACKTIKEFEVLAAASALMGSYFGIMDHVVGWMQSKGMLQETARAYLTQHFVSLSTVAFRNPSISLEHLRHEYSTKGGLNESMFAEFNKGGGLDALALALEVVLARIQAS